ncbi:MAG: flagellar motor switch protein FliN [Nitrospinota bacterium]
MNENEEEVEEEEDVWAAEDLSKQKEVIKKGSNKRVEEYHRVASDEPDEKIVSAKFYPEGEPEPGSQIKLSRILDIPLKVSVELGKSKMLINDLMQLGQGSVIELSKLVGDPLSICINKKLIGKGEVVIVREKFGIKLTEIVSTSDRIKSLG